MFRFTQKIIVSLTVLFFTATSMVPPDVQAGLSPVLSLPAPGSVVNTTPDFDPLMIKGLRLTQENPLELGFLLNVGDTGLSASNQSELGDQGLELVKYFMASLTTPEDQMWVNLSPYEQDRIIPESFGQTEMGRDLLAQDYMLKQLTASLVSPENELGQKFWERIYSKIYSDKSDRVISDKGDSSITDHLALHTENIKDVFHKIWILPKTADIHVNDNNVFVVDSSLKVMLEEDYMALQEENKLSLRGVEDDVVISNQSQDRHASLAMTQLMKDEILPAIEYEVNHGQTFAKLRQIYNSMILATWYKQALKNSFLGQVYVDQGKTVGVTHGQGSINTKIYNQYLEAFKVGVYDQIKEEYDPMTQTTVARQYFSGGADFAMSATPVLKVLPNVSQDAAMNAFRGEDDLVLFTVGAAPRDVDSAILSSKITLKKIKERLNRDVGKETRKLIDLIQYNIFDGNYISYKKLKQYFETEKPDEKGTFGTIYRQSLKLIKDLPREEMLKYFTSHYSGEFREIGLVLKWKENKKNIKVEFKVSGENDKAQLVLDKETLSTLAYKLGLSKEVPSKDKKVDLVPEFFSSKRAYELALEEEKVRSIESNKIEKFITYLSGNEAENFLADSEFNLSEIMSIVQNIEFKSAEDIKNGSPVLVMQKYNKYQTAYVDSEGGQIVIAQGLLDSMNDDQLQRFLFLNILEYYIQTKENKKSLNKQRGSIDKRLQKRYNLNKFIENQVNQFLDEYYEVLIQRNYVFDYEMAIFKESVGKKLAGGKTYQAGAYWSDDPDFNLRSYGASTTASIRLLKSEPKKLEQIYQILENLEASNEEAREEAYDKIRAIVLSIAVPEDIRRDLIEGFRKLAKIIGIPYEELLAAIRSAGLAEDVQITSEALKGISVGANAGQHDSFLGELEDALIQRWHEAVASLYTARVLDYRDGMMVFTSFAKILDDKESLEKILGKLKESDYPDDELLVKALENPAEGVKIVSSKKLKDRLLKNGFEKEADWVQQERRRFIDIEKIAMGVTIMPMADVGVGSFVAFGHDMTSGFTGMAFQDIEPTEHLGKGRFVTVSTNYQLGESIVQGVATPDIHLVHIFEDENGEEHINIIGKEMGTKTVQAVYTTPIMQRFGLTDDLMAVFHDFVNNNKKPSNGLPQVKKDANLSEVRASLRRLVEYRVEDTINQITEDDLKLFEYASKDDLKLFIHLLKETLHKPRLRTMFTDVLPEYRNQFVATESQIKSIAQEYIRKAKDYPHLVDMEGTIGKNFGRVNTAATVQRRPSNIHGDVNNPTLIQREYTYVKSSDAKRVLEEKKEIFNSADGTEVLQGEVLVSGIPTRNAFSGQIYKIDDDKPLPEQFAEIKALADTGKTIIIRTRETTPDYVSVLKYKGVVGVIADVGGATSHAAVVSRELGIATVVGIQKYVNQLEKTVGKEKAAAFIEYLNTSGNIVTVDANRNEKTGMGTVYAGTLPISNRKIHIDISRLPDIFTKIAYIMGMPHPMLAMANIAQYEGFSGVALQRGEFPYAEEQINPRGGNAYDLMLVYDYLRDSAKRDTYRSQVEEAEKDALIQFKNQLIINENKRNNGKVNLAYEKVELLVEEFKDKGPEAFWDSLTEYQKKDIEVIRKSKNLSAVTDLLQGYISYDEYFNDIHGAAVAGMAAGNSLERGIVDYRAVDFKKNEARELLFSEDFDPEAERATMIGERGARWLLQPENQVILRQEIRMLLRQVARGYKNIGYFFPFVSTPEELDQLLEILREEEQKMSQQLTKELGRNYPIYFREVGQMVELPSNILEAEAFIKVLKKHEDLAKAWFQKEYDIEIKRKSFLSFGTNDLTQMTLGADRDNPMMSDLFDESHSFVIESIRHVVNMARKYGIKCGLCGNALVNLADSDPKTAEELLLLLGQTDGYAGTDYLGTSIAVVRSASATLKHGVIKPSHHTIHQREKMSPLAQNVVSNLSNGAASRPVFIVDNLQDQDEEDLKGDLEKTFIGDYILFNEKIKKSDVFDENNELLDEILKEKLTQLGAIIYSNSEQTEWLQALSKKLNVAIVLVSPKESQNIRSTILSEDLFQFGLKDFISMKEAVDLLASIEKDLSLEPSSPIDIEEVILELNELLNSKAVYEVLLTKMTEHYLNGNPYLKSLVKDVEDELGKKFKDLTSDDLLKNIKNEKEALALKRFILFLRYPEAALPNNLTIDFNGKSIYLGRADIDVQVEAKEADILVTTQDTSVQELEFTYSYKSSDFYDQEERRHPLSYLKDEKTKRRLKEKLKAVIRTEFEKKDLQDETLVYETFDLQSDALERLDEHEGFVEEEVNPPLGFAGLDALMSDEQYRELFKLEMEAIQELVEEGYSISIQLNSSKVVESLAQAFEIINKIGFDRNVTKIGLNTAWPGNYLRPDLFIAQGLDFITLDEEKMGQAYLAADLQGNQSVRNFYDAESVLRAIQPPVWNIHKAASDANIPVRRIGIKESIPAYADNAQITSTAVQSSAAVGDSPSVREFGRDKDQGSLTKGGIDLNPLNFESFNVSYDDNGMLTEFNGKTIEKFKDDLIGLEIFVIDIQEISREEVLAMMNVENQSETESANDWDREFELLSRWENEV